MIKNVFFDLDGTLADTVIDLTEALNQALGKKIKVPLTPADVRPAISLGINAMIQCGRRISENDPEFKDIKQSFLTAYYQRSHQDTCLFPGVDKVLEYLDNNNISWGIVTNKLGWLTETLIKKLALDNRAHCVVSGDTTEFKKPHPQPLLYACEKIGCDPAESLYIGDSLKDMEAGHLAGMKTLIANYGYIPENQDTKNWRADGSISTAEEIIAWFKKENGYG